MLLLIDWSKVNKIKRLIISILIILLIILLIIVAIIIISIIVISIVVIVLLISIIILIDRLLIILLIVLWKRRKLLLFFWWNFFDVITSSNDLFFLHFLYESQYDNEEIKFFDVTLKTWIEMISCSKQLKKNRQKVSVFAMTNNALNIKKIDRWFHTFSTMYLFSINKIKTSISFMRKRFVNFFFSSINIAISNQINSLFIDQFDYVSNLSIVSKTSMKINAN